MKKGLIILSLLILLTGCKDKTKEEKINCFFQNTYEGSEFTTNIDVSIKNNIVTNATAVMTFKEESLAQTMCSVLKQTEDSGNDLICEDTKITINNYHKSVSSKDMTKEEFLEYMKNQEYICEAK